MSDGLDLLRDLMAPLSGTAPRHRGPDARDTQKSKVYAAEQAVEWSDKAGRLLDDRETERLTLAVAQYADKLLGHRPRKAVNVEINPGRGGAMCWTGLNLIRFTRPSTKRWVICHEVAHFAAYRDVRRAFGWTEEQGDNRPHGREFCALYLRLVSHWCGEADAKALRASMRSHGVRSSAKRVMSPEQKAAAVARLAATRPAMTASKVTYRIRIEIAETVTVSGITSSRHEGGGDLTRTFPATWGWFTGRRKDRLSIPGHSRYEWLDGETEEHESTRTHYEITGNADKALTRKTRASIEKALKTVPRWTGWTATIEEVEE